MVTVAGRPATALAEQRIILDGVSWDTYERLLADHLDRSVPHFTYDRGVLEIVSPSTPHEEDNRTLAMLVEVVAEELGIDIRNVGSMTFKREDLQRGFEPDSSFYIQQEERVSDRVQIDLTVDPPPDLVIEVEVANPLLDKLSIYAAMGLPEIWRVGGRGVRILGLTTGSYTETVGSAALPLLTNETLTRLLAESRSLKRTAWLRTVRAWVRTTRGAPAEELT